MRCNYCYSSNEFVVPSTQGLLLKTFRPLVQFAVCRYCSNVQPTRGVLLRGPKIEEANLADEQLVAEVEASLAFTPAKELQDPTKISSQSSGMRRKSRTFRSQTANGNEPIGTS